MRAYPQHAVIVAGLIVTPLLLLLGVLVDGSSYFVDLVWGSMAWGTGVPVTVLVVARLVHSHELPWWRRPIFTAQRKARTRGNLPSRY